MSEEFILSTATYRDQLVGAISELDFVPHALSQQNTYVSDIESKYQHCEKKLKLLSAETKKARKAHENWRDSHTLKLAHKLAGKKEKFAARECEEERIYVEALEREVKEKEAFEFLQQLWTDAKNVYNDLSSKSRERQSLKAELSSLYAQIFEGSSTAFPEHDELSGEVESTRSNQDEIQARLSSESHAVDLLTRADALMNACRERITQAISWDFGGVNGMGDFTMRGLLSRAQALADQASLFVSEAQDISSSVWSMGRISVMPGVLANNPFFVSDYTLQYLFRNTVAEVVKAQMQLKMQCEAARNRMSYVRSQLEQVTELLGQQREELDSLRSRIFTQIVTLRSNVPTDNPPPYEGVPEDVNAHPTEGGDVSSQLREGCRPVDNLDLSSSFAEDPTNPEPTSAQNNPTTAEG